jgi:hypothetical protein
MVKAVYGLLHGSRNVLVRPGDIMPFKSQAQRRKFAELLLKGEISNQTFEEWNRETGSAKLPERVKRTKKKSTVKAKPKRKVKRK